jgi:hypothetical protein
MWQILTPTHSTLSEGGREAGAEGRSSSLGDSSTTVIEKKTKKKGVVALPAKATTVDRDVVSILSA